MHCTDFVIVRADGRYVSRSGLTHSHTHRLGDARTFTSRAEAERNLCPDDNERIEQIGQRQPSEEQPMTTTETLTERQDRERRELAERQAKAIRDLEFSQEFERHLGENLSAIVHMHHLSKLYDRSPTRTMCATSDTRTAARRALSDGGGGGGVDVDGTRPIIFSASSPPTHRCQRFDTPARPSQPGNKVDST